MIVAASVYAAFHFLLTLGSIRRFGTGNSVRERISLIIAARNEAERIGLLLESLRSQTRPPDEIIIVDDRSHDGTSQVVDAFRTVLQQLVVVRVDELPQGSAPKKNALEAGIRRSSGDILCFTDADCIPPPTWIERIESSFGPLTGVVAGLYIPIWDDSMRAPAQLGGLFRRFIEYERFKTSALLVGSVGIGFPWLASGSNLAYRRRVFDEVGGYKGHHLSLSGDDDLFVQRVRRSTHWKVVALAGPDSSVRTTVPSTWKAFIVQRARHFSAGRYYDPVTALLLAVYHACNAVATMSLLAAFLFPGESYATAYVVKLSADLVLLAAADLRIQRSQAWTWFLPLEVCNVFYILLAGPLGWFSRIRWKEQANS